MILTDQQDQAIKSIVNVFETGRAAGDYGSVSVLKDGAGISYGRSQATDASNHLDNIVTAYCKVGGKYGDQMRPFIPYLADPSIPLTTHPECHELFLRFRDLLRLAGNDQVMRDIQDNYFDKRFFLPAVRQCEVMGLLLPLSAGVVYDSFIQGAFALIRTKFQEVPPANGGDEIEWVRAYVGARHRWLVGKGGVLASSSYRTAFWMDQISAGNWRLDTPINCRGVAIGTAAAAGRPVANVPGAGQPSGPG